MSERQVVTVRDLRKAYGNRVVVDGLDLDVPAGEIVGLIGANGAGKTTTVECVQGLRKPDSGQLRVLGLDPVTQAGRLRPLVGSQLQHSALPDRLRVAEALDLFRTPRARDGGELLEQFGLARRRRSVFSSLSGGERQRLFLVLALLNRPRLVILDELTQGLDPAARRTVWAAIRQLNGEGTTVLLVTHEMDEAEALCGQVVVMREGRVIDAGAPADLVERHASTAVIRFSLPDPPAPLLDQVRRLDGVQEVSRAGSQVTVRGHRRIIAYVGAALVRWEPVPADLSVSVPSLEDALLGRGARPGRRRACPGRGRTARPRVPGRGTYHGGDAPRGRHRARERAAAMIRVLLVDDQELVRTGLRGILRAPFGFEVVGECADGGEVIAAVEATAPDVVLMDVRMPFTDGVQATARLRRREGSPPVLALTTFDDDQALAGMLRAGASGFVLKGIPAEDLQRAVRMVADGGAWLDPAVTARVLTVYRTAAPPAAVRADRDLATLTSREREVLGLIGLGKTNGEIAAELFVSEGTVKTHVNHLFTKLRLRDRAAAVVFAFDHGLVRRPG